MAKEAKPAPDEADDQGDVAIAEGSPAAEFLTDYIAKTEKKAGKKAGDEGDGKKKTESKPKPKPFARRETVAPAAIDEEKLGAAIGKSIADNQKRKPADEKPAETDEEFSSPAEQRRLKVLAKMEELNPTQYKDLPAKYKASKKKLVEYAKKWESENEGEKFDEEADEHKAFIESLEDEADYNDDDYTEALTDIKADEKLEKANKPVMERLSEFERKEKVRESAPKIMAARDTAGNEFWKELGEGFEDIVDEKGQINAEALTAIKEADPDKYSEAISAVQTLETFAAEMYMLGESLVPFNKENPIHVRLGEFALACEADMLKATKDKQVDDEGRQFVPMKKWRALTKEQRSEYWTFTPAQLNSLMAKEIASVAQRRIKADEEKFERRATARGLNLGERKPSAFSKRQEKSAEELEEEAENDDGKPQSPESGGSPRMASSKHKGAKQDESSAETWVKQALG